MNKRIIVLIAFVCLLLANTFICMNLIGIKKTVEDVKVYKWMGNVNREGLPDPVDINISPLFWGSTVNAAPREDVKGLIADVRDFGAKGDGKADDTQAIQAAVNSLAKTGGTVLMQGDFISGNIKFPTVTQWVTVKVRGNWKLTETLVIPPYVMLSGQGGSKAYVQFSRRPQARLISPPGNVPVIKLTGMHPKIVENILINGSSGKAVLLQNGAHATLDNIAILSGNEKTSYPLVIDAFFWVWIRDSVFGSLNNAGEAIYITTTPGFALGHQSGIVEIRNSVIAGKGIKVAAEAPVVSQGALSLIDVVYESGTTPFLMLDSTHGAIGGIQLDRVIIADEINVSSVIKLLDDHPNVSNVFMRTYSDQMPLVEGGEIRGLFVDSSSNYFPAEWDLGSQKANYSLIRDGVIHGKWSGHGSNSPFNFVPYKPLNVNQDVGTWSKLIGLAKVETGIRAPDSTLTAAKLTSFSGTQSRRVFNEVFNNLSAGDWFIVGTWLKSESENRGPSVSSIFGFADGNNKFTNGKSHVFPFLTDTSKQIQQGWIPVVNVFKVGRVSLRQPGVIFDLVVDKEHPTSYWNPFAIHIPASAGISDDEIYRIVRYMVPIPSDAPAGSFAMFPHQKLWGASLVGSRGISQTTTSANNLRGSITISDSETAGTVTFGVPERDANYFLTVTPTDISGSPRVGSNRVRSVVKANAGFKVNLENAPGRGNSVTFDWHLIR